MINRNNFNNNFPINMANENNFNNIVPNGNFINGNNNFNNVNLDNKIITNNKDNDKKKNISFKFEVGKIYQTVTFDRCLSVSFSQHRSSFDIVSNFLHLLD